jgi:hypothetical protein
MRVGRVASTTSSNSWRRDEQPAHERRRSHKCVAGLISGSSPSPASRDYQRDIFTLFVAAEPRHFVEDSFDDVVRAPVAIALQGIGQPLLSEFLIALVERLDDPVRVD